MQESLFPQPQGKIYTVSELTREIKSSLEENFTGIWLTGEISNFHAHSSGHYYFTLKDEQAQIQAVMFRGSNRLLKFKLEDGLEVLANGRVTVYEARGNYQVILEYIEPKGLGSLQLAFEQLRDKLKIEGLFEPERKQALPFLPKTVGIITSPTGAVIRDMIHVLHRRNPRTHILLFPVPVQGEKAAPEIAKAIETMNTMEDIDVLIVARGGGSLEDLWAFNTEQVARAIHASRIPIISAVGHETDVTISDFVADLRAPTPSAAAELAVPLLAELESALNKNEIFLQRKIRKIIDDKSIQLKHAASHLKHPKRRLEELALYFDDLSSRLKLAGEDLIMKRRTALAHLLEKLELLSPLAILSRGYSIVYLLTPQGRPQAILKEARKAEPGNLLSIQLMKGILKAQVC
jgi:exodeoxyribonuclease VII large subunit